MAAYQAQNKKVSSCKCGPDYIDPMFHKEVLGVDSKNLDLFFSSEDELRKEYAKHAADAELVITEGVMGYYDGMRLDSVTASSYDVARTLDIPAVLILPCKGAALSLCAVVSGIVSFQKDSNIQGIILNRVSKMLYPRLKKMLEDHLKSEGYDIPVLGIFADEGITGTSTKKRTEFLRMIRQCKQKKIDLILTKSIQRFARNTLDCINYTRILRQLGIGVLFEKENINSLPPDSEFMITMYGAMAQSESESISGNIRRGRQMHAKVGTLKVPCYRLYGYEKDTEGKFRVIPEQAEIVRELYKRYESGASLRNLQDWLEENQIKTVLGESKWTTTSIKSILTNEKYCGDVLLQKTFRTDVISKKVIKNVGQMAQYYMPDHHEGIVSREQYNAVKAEMARRSALRSPSKTAVTGRSCYTSKYALSDRLVCGECGTLYRRCTWTSLGRKYPVWRCTSRLNYGTKYCCDSPTIKEEPLHAAILAAINSAMSNKPALLDLIKNAVSLELLPVQGQTMSLADIEQRLAQLDEQFQRLLAEAIDAEDKDACNAQFAEILAEQTALKKQKEAILRSSTDADRVCTRMKQAEQAVENAAQTITEWNENAVRQIVERVTVLSADEVLVRIKSGAEIRQRLER